MKFEEDSRTILKESLNYIGRKAVLGHLLYCNRLIGKQYCLYKDDFMKKQLDRNFI